MHMRNTAMHTIFVQYCKKKLLRENERETKFRTENTVTVFRVMMEGMKRMWLEGTQNNGSFHEAEFVRIIKELHKNEWLIIDEMYVVLEI